LALSKELFFSFHSNNELKRVGANRVGANNVINILGRNMLKTGSANDTFIASDMVYHEDKT